ncbi:MAG TPA: cyclic nucleotide-binding domain-containing protein [Aggregatilineales bacterium]|nr:cyclic nucleotide-binding domain-containing protein [Aggregatilineales bacterium]
MVSTRELSQISLFRDLSEEHQAAIARLAREVTCSEGDVLFREGDVGTQLYILLEGRVSIQVKLSSRPESLAVASLSQYGQLVGWSGLIHANYTASAVCDTDSRLLIIDANELSALLRENPEAGFPVMEQVAITISERLRNIQRVVLKTL